MKNAARSGGERFAEFLQRLQGYSATSSLVWLKPPCSFPSRLDGPVRGALDALLVVSYPCSGDRA